MSIDHLLARLTAQSPGLIDTGSGGRPKLTEAEISMIVSHAPLMAYHALMVKCCHDKSSLKRLHRWLHNFSLDEWFFRPRNDKVTVQVGHVNRLVDLAIIGWFNPRAEEYSNVLKMSSFLKTNHMTFRNRYAGHLDYLKNELDYLEKDGRDTINRLNQDVA